MRIPDDIKDFLPRYLTADSTKDLLNQLDEYIDTGTTEKIYVVPPEKDTTIYQGDCICDLPVFQYSSKGEEKVDLKKAPCIIISNTCDISFDNPRKRPVNICYAPLIELDSFYKALCSRFDKERADNVIKDIKKQKMTDTLFLPKGGKLEKEYIVFLDKILSIDNKLVDRTTLKSSRLFTLSNFGFYLFLLKLSINFTRVQEHVDRVFA